MYYLYFLFLCVSLSNASPDITPRLNRSLYVCFFSQALLKQMMMLKHYLPGGSTVWFRKEVRLDVHSIYWFRSMASYTPTCSNCCRQASLESVETQNLNLFRSLQPTFRCLRIAFSIVIRCVTPNTTSSEVSIWCRVSSCTFWTGG